MVQTRSQTENEEEGIPFEHTSAIRQVNEEIRNLEFELHVEDFHWQGYLLLVEKNDGKEKRRLFYPEAGEVSLIGYVMPNDEVVRIDSVEL